MPDKPWTRLPFAIDSMTLRIMADWAQSIRLGWNEAPGNVVMRTRRGDGRNWDVMVGVEAEPDDLSVTMATGVIQRRRPRVEAVSITPEGGDEMSLSDYDAVFWSEAAVEKFVLPYYAAKCQWAAAHVLDAFSRAFYGGIPNTQGGIDTPEKAGEEEYPFAVGHLPRSDYVELAAADAPAATTARLGAELHLLYVTGDRAIRAVPLSHFL